LSVLHVQVLVGIGLFVARSVFVAPLGLLMEAEVNDVRFRPERSGLAVPVAGGAEEVRVDGRQDG
jgi:hypothetical protein